MKVLIKLAVLCSFLLFGGVLFLNSLRLTDFALPVLAQVAPGPTPPANTNAANTARPANTNAAPVSNANSAPANAARPASSDKKIPKDFTLGQDSASEYGEVRFDHDTHAFKPYSPDGKSVVGCVECHHTDQPKSALKPPLVTSERNVTLTIEVWRSSDQKVSTCRSCHFQDGNVPDDKTMPTAVYTEGGRSVTKDLNNELAYHINCNTCHDAAAALRPDLRKKAGFATSKDCLICHKKN